LGTLTCRPRFEVLESRLAPATHIWTGASDHSSWSDPGNWSGGAPSAGESNVALIFPQIRPSGGGDFTINDITGLTIVSIQFTDHDYELGGNGITLAGDTTISMTGPGVTNGADFIDLDIALQAVSAGPSSHFDHVFDVPPTAGGLVLRGRITGPPVLNFLDKTGGGPLLISSPIYPDGDSFGGTTQVDEGTLVFEGVPGDIAADLPSNHVTVAAGATLDLEGNIVSLGSLSGAGSVISSHSSVFATLTIGLDDTSTTFDGVIGVTSSSSGLITLVKQGAGTFTLTGANTYQGNTVVQEGTVLQGADKAIPFGNSVELHQGATLDLGGHDANVLDLAGVGTVTSSSPATLTLSLIGGETFGGVIGGSISVLCVAKVGGTLTLNGVNTFTGSLIIYQSGTVIQGVDYAIPPVAVEVDGTLDLNGHQAKLGSLSGSGTVIYDPLPMFVTLTTGLDNTSTTFNGLITGNINLVKVGTGTFTLGAVNNYAGSTSVQAGALKAGVDNATPPNPCTVAFGATLDLNAHNVSLGSLSGAGTVSYPAHPIFGTLTTGLDNTSTTFDGLITGSINLVKAGSGTFSLGAVSNYAGSTAVQAGTLAVGIDNAYPPNPCTVALGATFDVNFHNETLGSLAGAGSVLLTDPTLTTGADNTSTTFSGSISGAGDLTKVGTGTFTLSGANTYTGQTTVLAGTLRVTGSLSPSTVVSVAPGAMLSGAATLDNATVNGTAGNDTFVIDTTGVTLNGAPIVSTPYTTLTVYGLAGNDTFCVRGTAAGSTTILNGGSDSNLFKVGSDANTLDPIAGDLRIQALLGQKPQVILDDSGNTSTAARTISLRGDPTFGYLVCGLTGGRLGLQLDPAAPVSIRTGATSDTFHFENFVGAPALRIDGGGGINALDYSIYTGDVSVILPLGIATGLTGGIHNIRNVTGSMGNDLLVGDANPNTLIGGNGRNILIGGAGADLLDASRSHDDNILIGGTTIDDGTANYLADLDAFFAEWIRIDLNFRDRYSDLTNGANSVGATPLNKVSGQLVLLNGQTVKADGAADSLIGTNLTNPMTGKRAHDWFFFDTPDAPLVNYDPSSDHKTKVM
jgi:autotransporter-associated beta strand protein